MRYNPVFHIELKRNSRSMKCSLMIFIVNLLLLVVAIGSCFGIGKNEMYLNVTQHRLPVQSYVMMGYTLFILISFIVPGLAAGAVTLEKERKSIDLLLVTPMSPWKIVFGKLQSVLFIAILIGFSSLPVFSLLLAFGGVSLIDLFAMLFGLMVTGIYLGSLGIFFSSLMKKTTRASIMTYITVVFAIIGTIMLIGLFQYVLEMQTYGQNLSHDVSVGPMIYLLLLNPFVSFYGLLCTQVGSGSELIQICSVFGEYSQNVIVNHLTLSSICVQLILSCICIYFSGKLLMPIKKFKNFTEIP